MISHGKDIKVFSGNATPKLAEEICKLMGTKLGESEVGTFSDGEVFASLYETVRGSDVFVVQSTCPPVNNNLMELLIMIRPHHGCHPLFRLCPPGPQGQGPRSHHRQASGQYDRRRRRRPRADHGPPRLPDSGLLRYPCG